MGEEVGVAGEPAQAEASDRVYPSAIRDLERELIRRRREAARLKSSSAGAVGVAISGGGIRSATFALGVFQALAEANLLRRFDYLSTVSGGGYFGSFLGALYQRVHAIVPNAPTARDARTSAEPSGDPEPPGAAEQVSAVLRDSSHPVIDHLRQNGQYLAPRGSDRVLFGAVLLRNWLALMVVLGISLLTVFLGAEVLWTSAQQVLLKCGSDLEFWVNPKLVASPWLLVAGLALLVAVPIGWTYWILDQVTWWTALIASSITVVAIGLFAQHRGAPPVALALFVGVGATAIALAMFLTFASHLRSKGAETRLKLNEDSRARHTVSVWLKNVLLVLGGALALGAADSFGRFLYQSFAGDSWTFGKILGAIWAALLPTVPFASKLFAASGAKQKGGQPSPPVNAVVTVLAALVLFLCLTIASLITQILARAPEAERFLYDFPAEELDPTLRAFAAFVVVSLLIGWTHSLINRSTHLPLYTARITRAYLGASNPNRYDPRNRERHTTKPHPSAATSLRDDDDIPTVEYFGWDRRTQETAWHKGGPLHIINTTVNETIDGRTKAHELDRKGLGLAIGPHGLSLGVRHHLTFQDVASSGAEPEGYSVFRSSQAQTPKTGMLSLGSWASISGAAFSTGLGSRTRAAFSFLAGMTNVRLGHWWFAPETRFRRPWVFVPFFVQSYLFRELFARFPGTADPFWYLSDGGHFENMGAYELIRRRLPFILVLDGEADPKHTYEGLANLVRKARLDFGAEIEFLERPARELEMESDAECPFGSLEDLRPQGERRLSAKSASLARVRYRPTAAGEAYGYLVYVKATLSASIPADLRHYADEHRAFPQETTIDQFFDEAQWESYRKLGELIGRGICSQPSFDFTRLLNGPKRAD